MSWLPSDSSDSSVLVWKALYENVIAPLTHLLSRFSSLFNSERYSNIFMDLQRWKESFETLIIFVDHRIDINPHTSTNLSASQICSPTLHSLASFYEGNLHSTQLATGSLKHETGGNKFPPSHRFNSFYYIIVIRIGLRPFCCKQTNHFVTVAPSLSFFPFCVTFCLLFAYPH